MLIAKKKPTQSINPHNFKIRKGSAKKMTEKEEEEEGEHST